MTNKVRVGIIGTSGWTEAMFLASFKSHPAAEISAICGRNLERAQEMATKYQIPKVFTDYRELLEEGNLDAVVVATPDDLHYQMTMEALDFDLHILCEKPVALNAGHAREMYEKAEDKEVVHMVLFTWRWQPHFRYLKQLVDEEKIGRIINGSLYFLADFGLEPVYRWRADGDRTNGVISDLGAHIIDFSRWYMGEITQVNAQLATFVEIPGIDNTSIHPTNDTAAVLLQFKNGAQGVIKASSITHGGDRGGTFGVHLYGDRGTLEADQIFFGPEAGAKLRGVRKGEERFDKIEIPDEFYKDITKNEVLDPYYKQPAGPRLFIDAILEDRQVEPNLFDGLKVQEVIDAALKSNQLGTWVELG
jgi:predicted dehydrogenase